MMHLIMINRYSDQSLLHLRNPPGKSTRKVDNFEPETNEEKFGPHLVQTSKFDVGSGVLMHDSSPGLRTNKIQR